MICGIKLSGGSLGVLIGKIALLKNNLNECLKGKKKMWTNYCPLEEDFAILVAPAQKPLTSPANSPILLIF